MEASCINNPVTNAIVTNAMTQLGDNYSNKDIEWVALNYLFNAVTGYKSEFEDYSYYSVIPEEAIGIRTFDALQDMNGLNPLSNYCNVICKYKKVQDDSSEFVLLSEGSYAKVYKSKGIAYKRISLLVDDEYYDPTDAIREIFILGMLSHENVMSMQSFSVEKDHAYIASEEAVTDLARFLYTGKHFSSDEWTQVYIDGIRSDPVDKEISIKYIRELLQGINYVHSCGILHRDIKPLNILIMSDGRLCICDFGSAVFSMHNKMEASSLTPVGTYPYVDIELLKKNYMVTYNMASDLWSVACIILEIELRVPLVIDHPIKSVASNFLSVSNRYDPIITQLESVLSREKPLQCISNQVLRNTLVSMLSIDPVNRITGKQALDSLDTL